MSVLANERDECRYDGSVAEQADPLNRFLSCVAAPCILARQRDQSSDGSIVSGENGGKKQPAPVVSPLELGNEPKEIRGGLAGIHRSEISRPSCRRGPAAADESLHLRDASALDGERHPDGSRDAP